MNPTHDDEGTVCRALEQCEKLLERCDVTLEQLSLVQQVMKLRADPALPVARTALLRLSNEANRGPTPEPVFFTYNKLLWLMRF